MPADPPPRAAGEAHWGSLHDAWQDTMLSGTRTAAAPKEPLPLAVIIAIVTHRVGADRGSGDIADVDAGLRRRVGLLRQHARDAQGRNWDIPASDAATSIGRVDEAELRRVVDALRDQFDIA
jgi:hypothetical protein